MKITFVLPGVTRTPVGGYKVCYQYANKLVERGHSVTLLHSSTNLPKKRLLNLAVLIIFKVGRTLPLVNRMLFNWFNFDSRVKLKVVCRLQSKLLPISDVTVLTAWETSAWIKDLPRNSGKFIQIVQDIQPLEVNDFEKKNEMLNSYQRNDIRHVAISFSVASMLETIGVKVDAIIPNGLEYIPESPKLIDTSPLLVLFSTSQGREHLKGLDTVLLAMKKVHSLHPEVKIECFGADRIGDLPKYILNNGYLSQSALSKKYIDSDIFVLGSRSEGWGLPALEAMSHGAAVVSTLNGGSEHFLVNERNALMVPVADYKAMADGILRLIEDANLRKFLSHNGWLDSKQFSLENSTILLEKFLFQLQ